MIEAANAAGFKVYDSDITTTEQGRRALYEIAWRAAYTYRGNWETMINWRNWVHSDQSLSDRQVRAVLNAVLGDSTQSDLWPAIRATVGQSNVIAQEIEPPKLKLIKPEKPKSRPVGLRLKAIVHAKYVKPATKNGSCHIIDHRKTYTEWTVERIPYHPFYAWDLPRIPQLHVVARCKQYSFSSKVVLLDEVPDGVTFCRACQDPGRV